jgi:hypothetical protein
VSKEVIELLTWLVEDGLAADAENDPVQTVRCWAAEHFAPLQASAERFQRQLSHQQRGTAGPFVLRATASDCVPYLRCMWDFDTDPVALRLRVALCYQHPSDQPRELRAVGYRYETPESAGRHSMHHVQPIRSLAGATGKELPGLFRYTLDDAPTFPLAASDAAGVVGCMLVSLYGLDTVAAYAAGELASSLPGSISRIC